MHEEDLDAASLGDGHPALDRQHLVAIAGFADPDARTPSGASHAVRQFTASAVDDGVTRASRALKLPARVLPDALPSTVLEWAASERLDVVAVPHAPVGPVQERMRPLEAALASEAVVLTPIRRRWDTLAWPHAARGFFPFREQIPRLLRQQGL
ncbi:MAG: hypothetical protein V4531_05400 [Actinomycetota bacterium]